MTLIQLFGSSRWRRGAGLGATGPRPNLNARRAQSLDHGMRREAKALADGRGGIFVEIRVRRQLKLSARHSPPGSVDATLPQKLRCGHARDAELTSGIREMTQLVESLLEGVNFVRTQLSRSLILPVLARFRPL